ncbi:14 kDa zinc-binding protein isoform X3 [Cucumis melo]|uniref:14 kDa zinc-binding protein isoform X3 n=1 Tax=Cucumis melo TaxID=3656 RepID=A0A1S4E2C2_CUCME|nr:14 kDa zinc-binding protein isoform X3 [Cucumis melo]
MAAGTSFLSRQCVATTTRTLVTAKLKHSSYHFSTFLLPLRTHSRRFDKIISKEISSNIVYEDDKVLAFRDINPQAPVHVLIIPKLRDGLTELGKAEARHGEILGRLLYAAKIVAEKEGIVEGFRVVINSGASACQSVYHLHLHVLGGRQMKWPPG